MTTVRLVLIIASAAQVGWFLGRYEQSVSWKRFDAIRLREFNRQRWAFYTYKAHSVITKIGILNKFLIPVLAMLWYNVILKEGKAYELSQLRNRTD